MQKKTIRPIFNLLSPEMIEGILGEAYILMETVGLFLENREARALFRDAGARVDETEQRVFPKTELVQDALSSTPSRITMWDREGEQSYNLGADEVFFNPGSAAVTLLDHRTGEQRRAETPDVVRFAILTDRLPHIAFQSTGLISQDVPQAVSDSYRLYLGLLFSRKPIVTGTFRVESFRPMLDMLTAIRGGPAELADKPLAIFDACPSPALKWSHLTTQSLIDCARAGIPSELISMGMTGATSPVTITGTLVQHVAENLCGLTVCQLAGRGAPVIFGGSPSSFDMRKGTTPMGAVETMMIDAAYTQIARFLRLPTHAYMGLSDSKLNDSQAGLETGIGAVLAALAGVNVISGPGMLDFESCQSLEKLVIDNEICGMALRLIQGVTQRDDPMALNLFEGFTRETQFLSMPHTRRWYREEHWFPEIIDRDTHDAWAAAGRADMGSRASARVDALLAETSSTLCDADRGQQLQRIMQEASGLSGAPELPALPADPAR